jgi:hypothetical protein
MTPPDSDRRGRLVVVGTGIRTVGQLTVEAIAWLKAADRVFHLAADDVAEELIEAWQPGRASSLRRHYREGRPRREAYDAMVAEIAGAVRAGETVCAAFYGHPGVFAHPPHEVIAMLRAEGYRAEMLPGISAEDCLFADLGVDPAEGCHSYEATNFLTFDHVPDPTVHLVLWQVGMLGDWTHRRNRDLSANVALLVEKLAGWYPLDHVVVLYRASLEPASPHDEQRCALGELASARVTSASTLYVRPAVLRRHDEVFRERVQKIR